MTSTKPFDSAQAQEGLPSWQPVRLIAAHGRDAALAALNGDSAAVDPTGRYRLALLNPTPERLSKAAAVVSKGKAHHGLQDIWYAEAGLLSAGGKLAFMYPGIDSVERPDLREVASHFNLPAAPAAAAGPLDERGAAVFYQSNLYNKVLTRLGIVPDLVCGHSLGEWSGMVASGYSEDRYVARIVATLQQATQGVNDLVFLAVGCGVEAAREGISGLERIQVSHDNCPHQAIVCGSEASVAAAAQRFRGRKIICQVLDFRSGFHTPYFRPHLGPLAAAFQSFKLSPPKLRLWSATTCAPYPEGEAAIRELMLEHLLQPVRFRELTRALYQEGARVFLQIGAGGLAGFVGDTLRGEPHLALSVATANRPGLQQLQRVCLALFAEGANQPLEVLGVKATNPWTAATTLAVSNAGKHATVIEELNACFTAIQEAAAEVAAALATAQPFQRVIRSSLSIDERPELLDHCFYKQKPGWSSLLDRFPVMPLTASIDLVMRLAVSEVPGRVVIAVENLSASRWLSVEEPKDIELKLDYDGRGRLAVEIVGHFAATLILATSYPAAPEPMLAPLINPRAATIALERAYEDGWLFHGPAYQGLKELGPLGDNGLCGVIKPSGVSGAVLDNVGQLAGLWIMQALDIDRYAMPIRIKRIEFFAPQPSSGETVCELRCERVRTRDIMFHMELSANGAIWARIDAWEKWRFESDARHWQFILAPGRRGLSDAAGGFTWFERQGMSDAMCDDLSRRYLRHAEREVYVRLGRKRQAWLRGRIAAKDAIRSHLWANGYPHAIYPAEIWLDNDASGKPVITEMPGDVPLYVSISHKHEAAVASVSAHGELGIDIERVEDRSASFEALVLTDGERALLPPEARGEWITRFWTAKEAFAKKTGRGLAGDPRRFRVQSVNQDLVRIEESWVRSTKIGQFIVSHTEG